MERMPTILTAVLAALLATGALAAEPLRALSPGAYDVVIRLRLPHVADIDASGPHRLCIVAGAERASRGLMVLSANNPLAACPIMNVREKRQEDRTTLTFAIACPGGNAAMGDAAFELLEDRFEGVITMKMGGKNMTMTETQSGRRVGACEDRGPPW
jgi:hypothetical protein